MPRNLVEEALAMPWKDIPDFIIGKDGLKIHVGDCVICGKDGVGYYGIGVVQHINAVDQVASVRLYPWLSPGWDGETYVFPACWLELDIDYENRRKQ